MDNPNRLAYSSQGLALTQQFEGLKLHAYQDPAGIWTIGYGHTGPDVHDGLAITAEHASELLRSDVATAVAAVRRLVSIPLTQNQFDALVDFVYNVGAAHFAHSTLLRELNAGDCAAAAAQFVAWTHCGSSVSPGLLRRRQAEQTLFASSAAISAGVSA